MTAPRAGPSGTPSALLGALAIDNLGSGLFLPFGMLYTTQVVGLPLSTAGSIVSLGLVVGLLVPAFTGPFVDRLGPRQVVVASQIVQALGAAAYAAAHGPVLVLIGAMLISTGSQAFYSSVFSLIAASVVRGPKDHAFALVNIVRGAAFGAGSLVAAVLVASVGPRGYRTAVVADGLTFVVAAAVLLVRVPAGLRTPRGARGTARSVLRDRPYLLLIATTMLAALATDVFLVGMPVYAVQELHCPGWLPGALVTTLTTAGIALWRAPLSMTRNRSRTRVLGMRSVVVLVWSAATAAGLLVPGPARVPYLLATTLLLALAGALGPAMNALAEAAAPLESRGRYLAAFQYAFAIATVLTPLVVALFAVASWLPWLVVALCAGATLPAYRVLSTVLPSAARAGPRLGAPVGPVAGANQSGANQ